MLWAVPKACCLSWAHTYCALIPVNLGQSGEAGLLKGQSLGAFLKAALWGQRNSSAAGRVLSIREVLGSTPEPPKKGEKKRITIITWGTVNRPLGPILPKDFEIILLGV